jgi:RimJ/RimL family protein N-acetyltransferase
MILETTKDDYARLMLGLGPRDLDLSDTPIAPPAIIEMLAGVADGVWATFSPASWLIVERGEVVGLCSVTRPPEHGVVDIGYGVAPSRQGRGDATRAVGDIVGWARGRADVTALTAETSTTNLASQTVLSRNGFIQLGERLDEEDGPLICWRCATA